MCVYSNSRNDVPLVAQRYRTIAAHTRRRASVLVVFVVFCVHMHSFAGLIRRTPPPTFSDTAITDRHSDTTIFQLRAHWERISPGRVAQSIGHLTRKLGVRYLVWQHTFVSPSAFSRRAVVSYWRKYVHEVLVNRLGGLSLHRKIVVRLTDRPDMTLDVYRGRKTTIQYKGADILDYWIGKIARTCAPGGRRTLYFLRARRAPYPLGQALCTRLTMCVCIPILVTTFPEWLRRTEPLPHTPGAVRLSSLCM